MRDTPHSPAQRAEMLRTSGASDGETFLPVCRLDQIRAARQPDLRSTPASAGPR